MVTGQLNRERDLAGERARADRVGSSWRKTASHAREARSSPTGSRIIDQPWVQRQHLGRCKAQIEVLKLMNWKQAWAQTPRTA